MKPRQFLLLPILFVATFSLAQTSKSYRNSIRTGINLMTVNRSNSIVRHHVFRYARHLAHDRIMVAWEGDVLIGKRVNQPFNGIDIEPNRFAGLTSDVSAFFDVLPSSTHALRLGVGFSSWYRSDDIFVAAMTLGSLNDPLNVAIDRRQRSGLYTGPHGGIDYEWLIDPRVGLDARFRVTDLRIGDRNTSLGVGLTFRF